MKEPVPFDHLVEKICGGIYDAFLDGGHRSVGYMLIAVDLSTNQTVATGNIKAAGVKTLLENCLENVSKVEEVSNE